MSLFRLTEEALLNLEAIGEYTEEKWGTAQRDKYLDALDLRFRDLAKHPLKGLSREQLQRGLRSYHEGKHIIFYLAKEHGYGIIITGILHESMEPSLHLKPKV